MHDVPENAAKPDAWRGIRSEEEIMRARAGYYGSIHHIDHQIGRLLMYLQKGGMMDNTLILFTSDHGDMLGDHHFWRKTYAYEGSAHIPPRLGKEQLFDLINDPYECSDLTEKVEFLPELAIWRNRLIVELEPRQADLTEGNSLVCQTGRPPIVSPKYKERMGREK